MTKIVFTLIFIIGFSSLQSLASVSCYIEPFKGNEVAWEIACKRLPKHEWMKLSKEEIEAMFQVGILCKNDKNPSAMEINAFCVEFEIYKESFEVVSGIWQECIDNCLNDKDPTCYHHNTTKEQIRKHCFPLCNSYYKKSQ